MAELTPHDLSELRIEIERLKDIQTDSILTKDLHKVKSIHNRLDKLYKLYERETGIKLNKNRTIERKHNGATNEQ